MGMELIVYVKNRDNRELEFNEVNGCREPKNAVMIDFFGGSNYITKKFRDIADQPTELTGTRLDEAIEDAKQALRWAQRRLRNYKEAPVEFDDFDSADEWVRYIEEIQDNIEELEGTVKTLNVWKYIMMQADIWLILSY